MIVDDLCGTLSADAMMGDLAEFAKRVKLSGTAEELESFEFIQARMKAMGFSTKLLSHDAYISLPGAASLGVGNEQIGCITHSFSKPSAPGGTRGKLVYLPQGGTADVAGKIVVFDGIANPAASLRATQAGAIGQIHVSPHEHKHEMCISPVWGSPTPETAARLPQTVVVSVTLADGTRLKQRLANGEVLEANIQAEVDTGWRKTPILVAEIAGPDDKFVMFSGHHDTWHLGVMDNGSANATMMDVARVVAARRGEWRRGLRLCFWSGHSYGRYSGSTWYADTHWDELNRNCVAHVNIDSTGAKGATVLADALTSSELRALGREAIAEQGGQDIDGRRMSRAGDQSFWGVGIPSMFMGMGEQPAGESLDVTASVLGGHSGRKGAGFGWWWHTPDDTLDKIDPVLLIRDAKIYVHTVWRLLTDAVLPLDYAAWAQDFLAELDRLKPGSFDISPLRERATRLRDAAATLTGDPAAVNQALMQVSRALVPIDYTSGDRFAPDPALGQSAYPPLDAIRALSGLEADSDAEKFTTVAALRARNRIAHALDAAISALAAGGTRPAGSPW